MRQTLKNGKGRPLKKITVSKRIEKTKREYLGEEREHDKG